MTNPRRDYRFYLHREHFLRHVSPNNAKGLEIGAFDLPLIEPGEGNCEFADYRSSAELKELAASLERHQPDYIAPVQYDLRQGYDVITERYNWIAAAHVIEHIPDVIGWLKSLESRLYDGGIVFLIIPDKRFTFDCYRRKTTVTDMVDAHRMRLTRPSFAQVFDHRFNATESVSAGDTWAGIMPKTPLYDYAFALEVASRAEIEYVDTHCSVFTPESFSRIFAQLEKAGIIPFRLGEVRSTQRNQVDFSAVLHRLDAKGN